ncbi:DedA family protein [Neobacillus ginsengisoli]|uniref:Membrane protein DedA with SNARE-associated domain n=1 Tax=Neobacillus ginsengisoli TaxID=904295 RepID=A0ABT9XV78_9BACI|nr:DedA family protein [Neobacillus ginsengisoli]MDQ0199472.1 membrane protein DedA with SNARE-associated domain [Neobacillus ginsengisoli]
MITIIFLDGMVTLGQQIDYLLGRFGYFGIILALIGGIIGLPIPDEVLLTYVGFNVYLGKMAYIPSLVSAYTGAIGGISLSYFLGIKLGLPFLKKYGPKLHINEAKINRTKNLFNKLGPFLLIIGYFIPGVRHITAYLAGINNYSYKKFALFAYIGALIWSSTFITLGNTLGDKWSNVIYYIERYRMFVIPLVVLIVIVGVFVFWRKRKSTSETNEVYE